MNLFRYLSSSAPEISEATEQNATHPVFWVVVGLIAIGFVIMIIQNFVIKKRGVLQINLISIQIDERKLNYEQPEL